MKNNYLGGIIGAIIGAFIPVLVLALCYIFIELTPLILAFFIPYGALIGYQLFSGKVDEKLTAIIYTLSFAAVIVLIFIVIPVVYLYLSNAHITVSNVINLLRDSSIFVALIEDFALSIVFAMSGSYTVVSKIKKQLKEGADKIDLKKEVISEEEKEKIKNLFTGRNALSKDFVIDEEVIIKELSMDKESINYLVNSGLIKKTSKGYYLNLKHDKQKKIGVILLVIFILIISILVGIYAYFKYMDDRIVDDESYENEVIDVPELYYIEVDGYEKYENEEETGYYFLPIDDLSFESGYIEVTSETDADITDFDALKVDLREVFKDENLIFEEDYLNDFEKRTLYYELENEGYYIYIYYIFNDSEYAVIEAASLVSDKESMVKADARLIANSIHWVE